MKRFYIFYYFIIIIIFISCNNKENKGQTEPCNIENKISLKISNYMYEMKDTLNFETSELKVQHTEYTWENDSTVLLKLYNFNPNENNFERKPEDIIINVELNARKGKLLEAGDYPYHEYENGLWSRVTINTVYGIVWFNLTSGMKNQGLVKINYIDKNSVCGEFILNVENPNNTLVGIVKLNGSFVYKKK